jgi:AAA+ ATPase superfamily predicted ATPase
MFIERHVNNEDHDAFWGREDEQRRFRRALASGGLDVLTGRRRVGKTALLRKLCDDHQGLYHQAVEGTAPQQLMQLCEESRERLPIFKDVTPRDWSEFFKFLSR